MRWNAGAACVLLFSAWAAGEPHLTVRAHDARTGSAITGIRMGLVDGESRQVYARVKGQSYSGERAPRTGDVLYVYCPGYDLFRMRLKLERSVEAPLIPVSEKRTLRVQGAGANKLRFRAQILLKPPGPWRRGPVEDYYVLPARGPRLEVAGPLGMNISALVTTQDGLLWPHVVALTRGREAVVHYVAPRILPVLREQEFDLGAAAIFPDRHWKAPASPREVDAWRWKMIRPSWPNDPERDPEDELRIAPNVPFHVFAFHRGRPVYRYVRLADKDLDLRGPHRFKTVAARPHLDGRPVLDETLIAPGRLDALTITALFDTPGDVSATCRRLGAPEEQWRPLLLAEARWLTTFHIDTGVGHMRWEEGRRPEGRSFPGSVVMRLPKGRLMTGTISLFPTWRGTGGVKTGPHDARLRHKLEGAREVRFSGLKPGQHGTDIRVRLTDLEGNPAGEIGRMDNVFVPEKEPHAVFDLKPR